MFGQTLETPDIPIVAFLVLLEGLLSADNALVLAIMVKHLPKQQQQKALLYGLGGAFVFRLIAIVLAATIIKFWWVQAAGALYLLYLPIKHFIEHNKPEDMKSVKGGFWKTVVAVEFADIAFAIDSVLAAVAMVNIAKRPDKIWVVYFGAIIGVVLLRFVASFFIRLLDRFPMLDHVAYVIVGWVGVKLAFMSVHNYQITTDGPVTVQEMPHSIFWGVLAVVAIAGTVYALRHGKPDTIDLEQQADIVEDVQDLKIQDR
jgi:YkoY family integral membrane protein